ncbi:MAG: biotin carboxylase N-terminal domain-containing protein [Immundisolibacteraceae bacterium]|nr:biotin carboxylase N-terminal domain-containing protein [Immundisolibacteraceae bacterium]
MLNKVLVANRGEIACRVFVTLRKLGITSVAVYSEADANARHVREADEAWPIGPAAAADSYLQIEKVIGAAKASGADAIHPGYGFLAESEAFAEACAVANIIFIGPSEHALRTMGLKDSAKAVMVEAGVPVVPGYYGDPDAEEISDDALAKEAAAIGYPLLIKAVAGGGGKGMRRVDSDAEFQASLEAARREAQAAFGDQRVMLEKFLLEPRHIEIQVFGDSHGNCLHLFERDCSLQRRHQKVVEESPSPFVDEALRQAMGNAAVAAARAVEYQGAGTVEFIVDADANFYFLEMNTRLQVEHPVTEMVTGLDLVEWQLRVAAGEPLPLTQEQVKLNGHSIEVRLYAETPENGFLPSIGRVEKMDWGWTGHRPPGIRIDTGLDSGDEVTPHYDPMVAKIIAHGDNREIALARLQRQLMVTVLQGPGSNLVFLQRLLIDPVFQQGKANTQYIDGQVDELVAPTVGDQQSLLAAAVRLLKDEAEQAAAQAARRGEPNSPWAATDSWGYADGNRRCLRFANSAGGELEIQLSYQGDFVGHGQLVWFDEPAQMAVESRWQGDQCQLLIDKLPWVGKVSRQGDRFEVATAESRVVWDYLTPLQDHDDDGAEEGALTAPMPGTVLQLNVGVGDKVEQGQLLMIVEAMKMEHSIVASHDGEIAEVRAAVGEFVEADTALVIFA